MGHVLEGFGKRFWRREWGGKRKEGKGGGWRVWGREFWFGGGRGGRRGGGGLGEGWRGVVGRVGVGEDCCGEGRGEESEEEKVLGGEGDGEEILWSFFFLLVRGEVEEGEVFREERGEGGRREGSVNLGE